MINILDIFFVVLCNALAVYLCDTETLEIVDTPVGVVGIYVAYVMMLLPSLLFRYAPLAQGNIHESVVTYACTWTLGNICYHVALLPYYMKFFKVRLASLFLICGHLACLIHYKYLSSGRNAMSAQLYTALLAMGAILCPSLVKIVLYIARVYATRM